jgi:putative membrane-bound dehydrogenase-like protein
MRLISLRLLSVLLPISALYGAEWSPIAVPGPWEEKGQAVARGYDGFAWYRTWVKVPDGVFNPHERNLWEESVTLNIRDLAEAHEAYINGRSIGKGGEFPPRFQSGRSELYRHKVPMGTLRKGAWNEIAIRVYNQTGPGGFLDDAPFLITYEGECVLAGAWELLLGDEYKPQAARADPPAGTGFDEFVQANRVLGRAATFETGPRLSPQDSLAKVHTDPALKADLLLSEPLVAQPTHVSFDSRGRMWVSQYRQYPYPAGVKMVSRDKYYRSYYDRIPPPPPNHDRGADVISIHEDTNGDGIYDRHKVFQDGLNMANAAVRGRGGVWVMHTPYLLFYPDANSDDVPDGPPVVHLQGFGLEDSHAVANGLIWGPDGWLYGGVGSSTTSRVTRPGMDPPDTKPVYFPGSMVWRYQPETREFEIFSEGTGNLFGLEFDAQGRLYSGHNGSDTRGWHYVQGGFYIMQGVSPARFGPPLNPYAFGDLPMMRSLTPVRRFSIFGAFAEGTAFPANRQGNLITVDPLHNELIESERQKRGATFQTSDLGRPMWSEDPAFRPVFAVNAPDGSLFIADFYNFYIAHGQHYQSQIDPDTGRIYRLRAANLPLNHDTNLETKSTGQLIALLSHPNKWHRTMAAFILGERKDPTAVEQLRRVLAGDHDLGALSALWTLRQMNSINDATLKSVFSHRYAPLRMWGVRLLGDVYGVNRGLGLPGIGAVKQTNATSPPLRDLYSPGGSVKSFPDATPLPSDLLTALGELARRETDAEVRSQLASTIRRLTTHQALGLLPRLVAHDEDAADPYIPLLLWWVLEAHLHVDRHAVPKFFAEPELWQRPIAQEHLLPRIMRRFALEGRRQDLLVCSELLRMAPSAKEAAPLLLGFQQAYRGRSMTGLPDELLQALAASGQSTLIARLRQEIPGAVTEAIAVVRDSKAPTEDRISYIRVFGDIKSARALPALLEIAAGRESVTLRKASLVALMAFDQPEIGSAVAVNLPQTNGDLRNAALSLLASRAQWSVSLLNMIIAGKAEPGSIPLDIVERLRSHENRLVADLVGKAFPIVAKAEQPDWARRAAEIERTLKAGVGNPYAGEPLFMARCASCHKLNFKGGNIGPDLTNYQRDNLGTMIPSIINPNAEIREGYQYYGIESTDGRRLSGFLVERDNQVVVMRGLEGENITLKVTEIKDMQPIGRSLMPEGLLDGMNEQQLRDFFAFLRIAQPLTR